jgi:4-diphosphocytidyl-2-C-methyl-D-erythritol kinase
VRVIGDTQTVRAEAKVNLFLEVLRRRPDGYHEVATLMVRHGLADVLDFERTGDGVVSLECDRPGLSTGPDNLVTRAAEALRVATGCRAGARVRLTKRIPMAAGLAGGSSDAAATLLALDRLWGTGLGPAGLVPLAAALGSDVAFFVNGGPAAWCTGRGEVVEPLVPGRAFDLVLVCPTEGLSTPAVYGKLRVPAEPVDGSAVRSAFLAGDAEALGRALFNRLQEPAEELSPAVAAWHRRLLAEAPLGALMSGSGSSLFALCRDRREAAGLARRLRQSPPAGLPAGAGVFVVRSSVAPARSGVC